MHKTRKKKKTPRKFKSFRSNPESLGDSASTDVPQFPPSFPWKEMGGRKERITGRETKHAVYKETRGRVRMN